jgi:hypothetical protein
MWDLWWADGNWDTSSGEFFGLLLSVSFRRDSILVSPGDGGCSSETISDTEMNNSVFTE